MKKNNATISDVAAYAGVSKSIVSNYLNKKYKTMAEPTKEKIEEAIKELNYTPNNRYRNYKAKQTGVIGLILPDILDPFHTLISKGITDAGLKYNYNILLGNSDYNIVTENRYIDSFADMTDGIILSSVGRNDEKLLNLDLNIPIVLLDRRISEMKYDVISSNNYESMQELMVFLTGRGYEMFALFTEELIDGTARRIRHDSYLDYASEKGIDECSLVYTVNLYDEKILMAHLSDFREHMKGKKSAIICSNGRTLSHVLSGINTLKWNITEDVGVCGYDDFEAVTLLHNGITTVSQPTYDMAYRCMQQIIARIGDDEQEPAEIQLRSKLIIRGSI